MEAFFNFCKFAGVLSGFIYINYIIEKRKNKISTSIVKATDVIPQFRGFEDAHKYFLSELHTGGIMIKHNDIENGVKHLANAVFVCNKPLELMAMFKTTMTIEVFSLLAKRLDEFTKPSVPFFSEVLEESFDSSFD